MFKLFLARFRTALSAQDPSRTGLAGVGTTAAPPAALAARSYGAERLERRLLFCAYGAPGYFKGSAPAYVYGTEGPDNVVVSVTGGCSSVGDDHWDWNIEFAFNMGTPQERRVYVHTQDYGTISLSTLGGNDTVQVRGLRDHDLSVDLSTGNDTLTVDYEILNRDRSIWSDSNITVMGGQGDDRVNYNAPPLRSDPSYVFGYIIDSNTFTIPGTRVAAGYQLPGESFFPSQNRMEYNGVENLSLTASPSTTAPTVLYIDSLASTAATFTASSGPTTVNVAPFVGGGVAATGGAGDDVFNIGKQTNGAGTVVNGGGGTNALNFIGTDGADAFTVFSNGLIAGHTVGSYTNVQSLSIDGGRGADSFYLDGAPALPYSIKGGSDNDTFTVTENVRTLPPIDGGAGANTLVLDHHNIVGGPAYYTFRSDGLQFDGSRSGFIPAANLSKFSVYGGSGDDEFLFAIQFPYFADAHGGYGDDTFTIGGGNLASTSRTFSLAGDDGTDILQLDDRFSSGNLNWMIDAAGISLGSNRFNYADFAGIETFEAFGNAVGTAFDVYGSLSVVVKVNAGGGSDTITLHSPYNSYSGAAVYPLYFDGGGGSNDVMVLDDRNGPQTEYDLYENRIHSLDLASFNRGLDVSYFFFYEVTVLANDDANPVSVYGTSNDITRRTSLRLGGGDDAVTLYPHDAAGNAHFASPLLVFGEGGADQVVMDDTGNPNGVTYTVDTVAGFASVGGMGTPAGVAYAYGDVESLTVVGGSGDDTAKVEAFQTGNAFRFLGGPGNDTLEVTPTSGNLATLNISFLGFDGGAGAADAFKVFNQNNPAAWTYTLQGNLLTAAAAGAFIRFDYLGYTPREETDITAGPAADQFYVRDAGANSINFLTGGGGADSYFIGGPVGRAAGDVLDNILGLVGVFGDAADSVVLEDSGDTTGDIAHIDLSFIGNYVGDTLFGPGGRVYYSGVATLTLNLGTGSDAIYAQPSAVANIRVNANGPTGATGDALYLALAGVQGYSVTPTGTGAGTVSSSNRRPLNYTGIDQTVQTDAVAPTALSGKFLFNTPKPSVEVAFSENVLRGLQTYSFEMENLTSTLTIPFDAIHLVYDQATNRATLTFPGLPNGILPDGRYRLTLSSSSFSDAFGNYSTSDFNFDFFALAGDFNRDGVVSVGDLGVLATNFNRTGQSFSRGDANYDGVVSVGDLGILSTNFNKTLPPAPAQIIALSLAKAPALTRALRTRRLAVFR